MSNANNPYINRKRIACGFFQVPIWCPRRFGCGAIQPQSNTEDILDKTTTKSVRIRLQALYAHSGLEILTATHTLSLLIHRKISSANYRRLLRFGFFKNFYHFWCFLALWKKNSFSIIQQNCVYPRHEALSDCITNVPTKFQQNPSNIHQEKEIKLFLNPKGGRFPLSFLV